MSTETSKDIPEPQPNPPLNEPQARITLSQQMAAACTGALITSIIVTPFDVVKIRLQAQQKSMLSEKCYLYCNGLMDHLCPCGPCDRIRMLRRQLKNNRFRGTIDAFVKISRNEGITALWSGLSPTLLLAVPATVVYFVSYEQIRVNVKEYYKGVLPFWAPLIAGAMARTWSVTLVCPLELIRTKMQSKKVTYSEIGDAIKAQVQTRGWRGLWRGLGPTLMRDVPFSGIYWLNYECFKDQFSSGKHPSFGFSFLAGATAGSIAALVTTPFDVVKTHQQIELGEKEIYTEEPKPGTSLHNVIHRIYQQNGLRGLFTGLVPRLVKVAPACAIMISTFEYGKSFFLRTHTTKDQ